MLKKLNNALYLWDGIFNQTVDIYSSSDSWNHPSGTVLNQEGAK